MALFDTDMNGEFKRYATFSGFQTPAGVWPSQLAQGGFYRAGSQNNDVVCFACGLRVNVNNFSGDSVMNVHRRLSPECSFVSGSSANQPVPPVDTQGFLGLDWLAQNFSFANCHFDREFEYNSLPSDMLHSDVEDDGGMVEESTGSQSLPPFNFSHHDTQRLPILSDLNTLEHSSNLDSLPMDLVDGFANTNLESISTSAFLNGIPDPESQAFASLLGGEVVTDSESVGIEGVAPAPLLQQADIANYTAHSQALTSTNRTPTNLLNENIELETPTQKITFDDLGIVVQRPKRQDLSTLAKRLQTFERWQGNQILQSKESIAEAGFYYAGYSDCCRCFYCGGGLKSWEKDDNPWIEHARWFKDCPYIKTSKGSIFITAVLSLARTNNTITMKDVEDEMKLIHRPAILDSDGLVTTEQIGDANDSNANMDTTTEMSRLEDENDNLKRPEMCKICLDDEVSVLFVPCGHLVTCYSCSPSVIACPVCRQQIQGRVKVSRD